MLNGASPERHYCTYFDHRYLPRGLAMARSLRRQVPDAVLWILCLDDGAFDVLRRLDEPGCRPIPLAELESSDQALLAAKATRSTIEYYFTCTPCLVRHLLEQVRPGGIVTYLDADLWFFADPEPVFAEMGEDSVVIIPHRRPPWAQHLDQFGTYNVGWVSFRRDGNGTACASWWRERCLEWCYDRPEGSRYADQGYLENFPMLFPRVHVLAHRGANLAPWNICGHRLTFASGGVLVDQHYPLLFFHFHGVTRLGARWFLARHRPYGRRLTREMKICLYEPYLLEVLKAEDDVNPLLLETARPVLPRGPRPPTPRLSRWLRQRKRQAAIALDVLHGQSIWISKRG